ncbi:unnamed protein product [Urochloa decumbens]|uniref:DUF1618 domain-containing protein n=1 Tax=Urochloa decumbens TaxID=240449 RepID=A0ABC8ZXD2_9POAL
MPKRQCRGECDGGRAAKRRRRQRQLYLVFDDWSRGYSIRKVTLPPSGSVPGDEQQLPRALLRFAAERGCPQFLTSAFGGRIVVAHPDASSTTVPVIDVRARAFMPGPRTNHPAHPIYIPVGADKLFALDIGTFELCCSPAPPEPDNGEWPWREVQKQPFNIADVSSNAVGYEERAIFVSTKSSRGDGTAATFTFDIVESVWKKHGEWALPFTGRGYFDRDLDAFVGLSKDPENLGYLCCCHVAAGAATGNNSPSPDPDCRRSKEKVYNNHPDEHERHVSATLVYGRRSKFCLVECVSIDEDVARADHQVPAGTASRYMYRLITFTLRYDRMGDVRVKHYRVRCCYKVPRGTTTEFVIQDPVAFWL